MGTLLDKEFSARVLGPLGELVALESVTSDPEALTAAADAILSKMRQAGISDAHQVVVKNGETTSAPYLLGSVRAATPGKKTVLVYGHYDVVAIGGLDEWNSDPFKMQIRDGRVYGRGVADDKYAIAGLLAIVRASIETGVELPFNLEIVLEGEEESGSKSFPKFMEQFLTHRPDLIVVVDMGNEIPGVPSITNSTKGAIEGTLRVDVASKSGHSGLKANPLDPQAIAFRLLEKIAPEGVVIPELQPPPPSEILERSLARLPSFDPTKYAEQVGLLAGVSFPRGFASPAHFLTLATVLTTDLPNRPVSGVWATAPWAEVHFVLRLGPGIDPEKAKAIVEAKMTTNVASGVPASIRWHQASPSWSTPADGPALQLAANVFGRQFNQTAVVHGAGGGVPILWSLSQQGTIPVVGFGAFDTQSALHGPNESLDLKTLKDTVLATYYFLLGYGLGY